MERKCVNINAQNLHHIKFVDDVVIIVQSVDELTELNKELFEKAGTKLYKIKIHHQPEEKV